MTVSLRRPCAVLLALLLAACGDPPPAPAGAPAAAAPEAVDPAGLEQDVVAEPEAPLPAIPDWAPVIEPVPARERRAALRDAAGREQAGLWVTAGSLLPPEARPAAVDGEVVDVPAPGALELYLGLLATDPGDAEALAGVERVRVALDTAGREALQAGRLREAESVERVLARAVPQHAGLTTYRDALAAARAAMEAVRLAEARARAGRVLRPEGAGAVAAYQGALARFPGFQPALDGLARLQAERLNRAFAAAQAADYPAAERLLAEAGRVLADSPALQDMSARIVELRQARAAQLLAQGDAAVDAMDLELAERRLAEAGRASVQAQGLDTLAARIALARHYGRFRPGERFREPLAAGGTGPEMIVLAHGAFEMGSPDDEAGREAHEGPRHRVGFARGFALARSETTVGEFRRFVEASGYRSVAERLGRSSVYDERGAVMAERAGVDWRHDFAGRPAAEDLPVVHVAFEDAEAYAAWLAAQTGQPYRLPSEAEFEYALRAGRSEAWPWGAGAPPRVPGNLAGDGDQSAGGRRWSNAIAGHADGHWGPAPVRSYPAEGFATFDLVGNVAEWVLDCWHDSYRRAPADGSAWVNPGCSERVVRGASWASTLERARSAARQAAPAGSHSARIGFRVARSI